MSMPALVGRSPLGQLAWALAWSHHQLQIEGRQDQQQALHGESPRLQFELGEARLAGATGLERQLLLAHTLLAPHPLEEQAQLGGGQYQLLLGGHGLLGISINAH